MTTTAITHIWNEEFLLPFWLRHHVPMFDHGIVIDYASTDRSLEIVADLAPHWEVRQSRNAYFDAAACDSEVMEIERSITGWKIALTATEFFHCKTSLPEFIDAVDDNEHLGVKIRPVGIVDMSEHVGLTQARPLTEQCHHGFVGGYIDPYKSRVLHRGVDGAYTLGRHDTRLPLKMHPHGALLLWYGFAPWTPELRSRRLQIQQRIPDEDKRQGYGVQHNVTKAGLYDMWQQHVALSSDLRNDQDYMAVIG